MNLCPLHVQSPSTLNVAAADTLPADVDSVFFNLCPAWGFVVVFLQGTGFRGKRRLDGYRTRAF